MPEKIQLHHPAGKHADIIDKDKYDVMRSAILTCLQNGPYTHKELEAVVIDYFKKNNIKFEGSLSWYMESVKLDLEAKQLLERSKEKSKLMFRLVP